MLELGELSYRRQTLLCLIHQLIFMYAVAQKLHSSQFSFTLSRHLSNLVKLKRQLLSWTKGPSPGKTHQVFGFIIFKHMHSAKHVSKEPNKNVDVSSYLC